jgi:hypothetical protein
VPLAENGWAVVSLPLRHVLEKRTPVAILSAVKSLVIT